MTKVNCPGCSQMVFLFQGACTECQTVVEAQVVGKVLLYCRATGCDQTLKPTHERVTHCMWVGL